MKFKIYDLATGNKNQEEWTVLPSIWPHDLEFGEHNTLFEKQFVLIDMIMHLHMLNDETRICLILNLATRKRFWLQKEPLEDKMREKAANLVDKNGEPYILQAEESFKYFFLSANKIVIPSNNLKLYLSGLLAQM